MTDIELLKLAAKAAGLGLPTEKDTDEIGRQCVDALGLWVKFLWGWGWWNPLHNDGDALRLAVKLNDFEPYNSNAGFRLSPSLSIDDTRRAIVRAAAEIGRNMPMNVIKDFSEQR